MPMRERGGGPRRGVVIAGMVTDTAVAIAGMVGVMAVHVADVNLTLPMGHRCLL
jgi:hypothetical protein